MWSGLVLRNHGALSAVTVDEVNLSFAESRTRRLPVGEGASVDTFVRTSAIELLLTAERVNTASHSSPSTHEQIWIYRGSWSCDPSLVKFNITRGHKHWYLLPTPSASTVLM
jgi:hypothetical protein